MAQDDRAALIAHENLMIRRLRFLVDLTFATLAQDNSLTLDEAWEHGHLRKVDDGSACRHGRIFSNRFDLAAAYNDYLVAEDAASIHINKLPSANHGDCGWGGSVLSGYRRREEREQTENKKTALKHSHPPNRLQPENAAVPGLQHLP